MNLAMTRFKFRLHFADTRLHWKQFRLQGNGVTPLMARFEYRLQKVYELRERKKKEQERVVQEAKAYLQKVENKLQAKKQEIRTLRNNMLSASHTLMDMHDRFIQKLNVELDTLTRTREIAERHLENEKQALIKAQAEFEALVKHKEKAYEEYLEEEKRLELKMLDEVAGQRYFRTQQEELLEESLHE